jgi:hypothetical protein
MAEMPAWGTGGCLLFRSALSCEGGTDNCWVYGDGFLELCEVVTEVLLLLLHLFVEEGL